MNELTFSLLEAAFLRAAGARRRKVTPRRLGDALDVVWGDWRYSRIIEMKKKVLARFAEDVLTDLLGPVMDQAFAYGWNWEGPYEDAEYADYAAFGIAAILFYRHNARAGWAWDLDYSEDALRTWLKVRGDNGQLPLFDLSSTSREPQ